jgi:hypothetical protein
MPARFPRSKDQDEAWAGIVSSVRAIVDQIRVGADLRSAEAAEINFEYIDTIPTEIISDMPHPPS